MAPGPTGGFTPIAPGNESKALPGGLNGPHNPIGKGEGNP